MEHLSIVEYCKMRLHNTLTKGTTRIHGRVYMYSGNRIKNPIQRKLRARVSLDVEGIVIDKIRKERWNLQENN